MSIRHQAALRLILVSILVFASELFFEFGGASEIANDGDEVSMFQRPMIVSKSKKQKKSQKEPEKEAEKPIWPMLIPLEKESVPIVRNSRIVSHKTSFSGKIRVGSPSQDFKVVFDTGSGHIVVPSSQCTSETCLAHRRYNMTASSRSVPLNADGTLVPEGDLCDQVTIGYGTGEVMGELARDKVCLGADDSSCIETGIIMAVEMTEKPFKSFQFDGIFGLSLDALAVSPIFSFHNSFEAAKLGALPQFGIFLSAEAGLSSSQSSEIALGGYNPDRLLTPLKWVPVAHEELGHWMVTIKEVRIGNKTLNMCQDGSCRGVVDSGTSHLGVPTAYHSTFARAMSVLSDGNNGGSGGGLGLEADDTDGGEDCRGVEAPTLELVLEGFTVNIGPEFYMRSMPVKASSVRGLLSEIDANPKSAAPHKATTKKATSATTNKAATTAATKATATATKSSKSGGTKRAGGTALAPSVTSSSMVCAPKTLPMKLPALGQNVFILGEPLLNRYYTAYDWKQKAVGFGLSAIAENRKFLDEVGEDVVQTEDRKQDDEEEVYSFVQMTVQVVRVTGRGRKPQSRSNGAVPGRKCDDHTASSLDDEAFESPSHLEL
mmetsp:Transcript_26757/g.58178  ORF Transcript_26757/g.58178 Transcript_26757/m.58178 type:complete len:603 (-) Transcript_26757:366-2174(-)|eukprot:CAMPEP_0206476370 /NCGR_PEP_ID=MMETSP0324_2-20121206/34687_1 /ASSEMBLY_ACC=CAM_ASM_000836 /TAXON_ID=2866 /ORGANISM="Crypthecodinium cohnii, Strain Seligo" /LENGTH=602 /DNA_ID=CAMNT_0053952011 /DNA_START=288 /DNA_END=2096 /DNA_ORIENTATION=+